MVFETVKDKLKKYKWNIADKNDIFPLRCTFAAPLLAHNDPASPLWNNSKWPPMHTSFYEIKQMKEYRMHHKKSKNITEVN